MPRYSVLVTNSRNGGQLELLIETPAATSSEAWIYESLAETKPHYIIKRIDPIAA
jgi:hypothetical protein